MASRSLLLAGVASLIAIGSLISCGGDEFTSDAPSGSAGQAGGAGAAGKAGSAGAAGTAGAAGKGGTHAEGGLPEASAPDAPEAEAGAGGAPPTPEAGPDGPPVIGPQCVGTGFSFEPNPPTAQNFKVFYTNPQPFACIRFAVQCELGLAVVTGTTVSTNCQGGSNCWQAEVGNCLGKKAKVSFFKEAGDPLDPACATAYPGSDGVFVQGCDFVLVPVDP